MPGAAARATAMSSIREYGSMSLDGLLQWIGEQRALACGRVELWARINSGSLHRAGLEALAEQVANDFAPLGAQLERVPLPPYQGLDDAGEPFRIAMPDALVFTRRPEAPHQVLLAIHLDTVFPADHPFQDVVHCAPDRLHGPGVADAKGGLAVMLAALEALERSGETGLGWRVVLNPDEELGSPCSAGLLAELAPAADFGLVFEPALPDGALINRRKGSGNFTVSVEGRAAHVGRAFKEGASAVHALVRIAADVAEMGRDTPGAIANVGFVRGGGPVNVVADRALARLNLRVDDVATQEALLARLHRIIDRVERSEGVKVTLHGTFQSPPKPFSTPIRRLAGALEACAADLPLAVQWRASGGVCDGNKLSAAGLPTLDTLGAQGGEIHSDREYLCLDSLVPRAQLVAALLYRYARGEWSELRRSQP